MNSLRKYCLIARNRHGGRDNVTGGARIHKSRRDLRHLYFIASKEAQDEITRFASEVGEESLIQGVLAEVEEIVV
ncbi:MAG: hypothetical protein AAF456_25475 [Planctomycetota bacterium]